MKISAMKWTKYPIKVIEINDKGYPSILKKINNPPLKLFYRGNINNQLFTNSIAIVGSRSMTNYGKMVTEKFVSGLVLNKVTIISGFMYGVDSFAHQKTMEYGGLAVAVFGNGLDVLYPPENDILYDKIIQNKGIVLSEYKPKAKPHLWTYVQRNRIVAGLSSLGVLVIEAGEKSGSLVTAEIARKQNKNVYAVPGPITSSTSSGTNFLIKKGLAKMATSIEDILGNKFISVKDKINNYSGLKNDEEAIVKLLQKEPLTIDEISGKLNLDIVSLIKTLTILSLKGITIEIQGRYQLKLGRS